METLFGERLRRWSADPGVPPALEMPGGRFRTPS